MFNAYLLDTVNIIEDTGDSVWSEKSTKSTTISARVETKTKLVKDSSGEQVVSVAVVSMKDRILSPSSMIEIDGVKHPILRIDKKRAFRNMVTLEVQIG